MLEKYDTHASIFRNISENPSFQAGVKLMQHRFLAEYTACRFKFLLGLRVPDKLRRRVAGQCALFV